MSLRWRDKKNEPGFVYHPWMSTVDELEDQIDCLITALKIARKFFEPYPRTQRPLLDLIDAVIAKVDAQP